MKTNRTLTNTGRALLATALVAVLVACGGGGGSGGDDDSVESVVSRGAITQLGSIWVNGCRYVSTSSGHYQNDDDDSASFDDYQVGMVVSVRGSRRNNSNSCVAYEVEYEAEIEGPADNGSIHGIEILFTSRTNSPGITSLVNGTHYEVSGIWIDDFTLEATFVKQDDDGDDEIKGFVSNDQPASFDVHGITFNWTGTPDVSDGDFVEVHFGSCTGTAPNLTCQAIAVELEDDFFSGANGTEVEIEGAVDLSTAGCPASADFKIDNVCIDYDTRPAQWLDGLAGPEDMAQGSRVEAEGHMSGGVLIAEKIKGRGNRVRISSVAENVVAMAGTFTLVEGNISVITKAGVTQFEDGLTIDNIAAATDGIEVRGVRTGATEILAIRIKQDGLSGGGNRHEVRAEVDLDGADSATGRITVMTLVSQGNGGTELEVEDSLFTGSLTQFLDLIDDNDDPADGSRDVVEVGFDITGGDGSSGSPYTAEEIEIEEEDD